MARALGNIVRNAVAYADDKSTIVIEAGDSDEATTISISNKGKEISKIHLDSIFEKFYREDTSRSQSKGGAGLGLAIAQRNYHSPRRNSKCYIKTRDYHLYDSNPPSNTCLTGSPSRSAIIESTLIEYFEQLVPQEHRLHSTSSLLLQEPAH